MMTHACDELACSPLAVTSPDAQPWAPTAGQGVFPHRAQNLETTGSNIWVPRFRAAERE